VRIKENCQQKQNPEVYPVMSSVERKIGVESIHILLYNKEMGLAQSPVLWEPEEHRVSMLARSLKV